MVEPVAGSVIVTTGATVTALRVTVIDVVAEPAELLQTRVIVLAPIVGRFTLCGLLGAAAPLRVQLGAGKPEVVKLTSMALSVVDVPSAGSVMTAVGATLRVTVIESSSEPAELLQSTVIVFEPGTSATLAGLLADGVPLTVQVGVGVPVAV